MDNQYRGTGRRKSAVARVRLLPGNGKFVINKRDINDYFNYQDLINTCKAPLKLTSTLDGFDVYVRAKGGGYSGQADAIRLGVARALCEFNPDLRTSLKKVGYLTRDSRKKESYKYGFRKARKSPQYSKR